MLTNDETSAGLMSHTAEAPDDGKMPIRGTLQPICLYLSARDFVIFTRKYFVVAFFWLDKHLCVVL